MIPLYRSSAAASAVYSAVIVLWLGSEVVVFIRTVSRDGVRAHVAGNRHQDRFSGPVLIAGVILSIATGANLAEKVRAAALPDPASIFVIGALLALAGIAVRWYSILTLGRFFSMRVETSADQQVVQSGPYRFVRHPSYTGGLLTILGVLLMSTNWLSLLAFVVAWPGFAYRIRVEEDALVGELGDRYRSYMRRSKRLVPFVV